MRRAQQNSRKPPTLLPASGGAWSAHQQATTTDHQSVKLRIMRFLCLTERITTPSRVGSSTGLDEEEDPDREIYKNLWRRRRLLPPKGSQYSKRHRWRTFLLVLVAYEQIYIPLQLAFQLPRPAAGEEFQLPIFQLLLQYTIDVCFMIDMLLVFRTTLLGRPEDGSPIIADTRVRRAASP